MFGVPCCANVWCLIIPPVGVCLARHGCVCDVWICLLLCILAALPGEIYAYYIAHEDIEAVTAVTLTNKVYDMCRAITQKKYTEAMRLYEDLLALRESPMSIIYKISRQFKQLLDVKDLIDAGCRQDAVMSRLHLPSFVAGKLIQQARGYDRNALMAYVDRCLELEEAFKTGDMPERIAVELLICG